MLFGLLSIDRAMKLGNMVISQFDGGKNRPVILKKEEFFPELSTIETNFDTVKKEYEEVNKHFEIPAYHEIEKRQYAISGKVAPEVKWKVFLLYYSGEIPELAKQLSPETCAIVSKIPGIYKAFYSVLEPGKSIPAHHGPYRGYLRYHLGIKVPKKQPPSIRIKDEIYHWKERESLLFDDTWDHEVRNESKEERVVLILDLLRPLPYFPDLLNRFITKVLMKKVRINKVLKDVEKLNKDKTH